jgi:hypothetical protein
MRTESIRVLLYVLVVAALATVVATPVGAQPPVGADCEDISVDPPLTAFSVLVDWELVLVVQDDGSERSFFDVQAGEEITAAPGQAIVRIFKCTGVLPPTVTPTPQPTATPEPTSTPVPTPQATSTPEPTPQPTATPAPTATPNPTAIPELTSTPQPLPPTPQPTVRVPQPGGTPDAEVLGLQQERLAQTGSETPLLGILGIALVAVGAMVQATSRIIRRPTE